MFRGFREDKKKRGNYEITTVIIITTMAINIILKKRRRRRQRRMNGGVKKKEKRSHMNRYFFIIIIIITIFLSEYIIVTYLYMHIISHPIYPIPGITSPSSFIQLVAPSSSSSSSSYDFLLLFRNLGQRTHLFHGYTVSAHLCTQVGRYLLSVRTQ